MFEVHTYTPIENPPPEAFKENAFLYRAEVKPLDDPPEPGDDDVQEIAVDAGTPNEIRLIFNAKDPDLSDRVAGVCNSYYVNSGMTGIQSLIRGVTERGFRAPAGMPAPAPKEEVPDVKGEKTYSNPDDSPKREAIRAAVSDWQVAIDPFIKKAVARVQAVALVLANTKLQANADETLRQSVRYLQSGAAHGSGSSTNALVRAGSPLTGRDVESLAMAMVEIAALRREQQLFANETEAAQQKLKGVGLTDQPAGILGPGLVRAAADKDLRGLLESPAGVAALGRATQGLEAANRLLAQECSRICRVHPVLYRLWDQQIVLDVADLWNSTPAAQRLAAVQQTGALAAALTTVFNDVSAAANEFIADLRSSPESVWRYDNAIYAALRSLHLGQGDIAWRAVEDQLVASKGVLSPLSQIGMGLGLIDMIAGSMALAPPVGAVLAILMAGVGVASLVEDTVIESQKDRAFQSCLDPSQSLALEPSSYGGIVFGAVLMIFQLKGAGKSVGKALAVP